MHDFQNALFTTLKKWKFNTPIIYFKACCPFSNKYANFKRFYRHFINKSFRESWTCPFFLGQNTSIKEMDRGKSDHLFGEIMDGPVALRPLFSALDWQWKSYKNLMSMTNLKIDNILMLYSTEKCWKMEIRFTGNHLDSNFFFLVRAQQEIISIQISINFTNLDVPILTVKCISFLCVFDVVCSLQTYIVSEKVNVWKICT